MNSAHPHYDSTRGQGAVHVPGGRLLPDHWTGLAALASAHRADIQITPRGGMRISRDGGAAVLAAEFAAAGLPAGLADPRARDILASPMAGRLPGHHDLADLPERLASTLLEHASETGPGSDMLFGLDDGSGDVLAHSPDLAAAVVSPENARIHVAGRDAGFLAPAEDAAAVLAEVAIEFWTGSYGGERMPGSGRMHDVVVDLLGSHPLTASACSDAGSTTSVSERPVEAPRVGWVDTSDGLVSLLAVVPHGLVPARLAEFLGAIERPSTISADRVIGLHELTEGMAEQVVRVLAPMGMIFDVDSPWATGSA